MESQFFKGRDNSIKLSLFNNGVLVSPSNVRKVELKSRNVSVNSIDNPDIMATGVDGYTLKFGFVQWPVGAYKLSIYVYSSDNPNGVLWGETLNVKISA